MEALLPSEIARLVLGYLEDQKCAEAAKLFLETSPHLQECRTVLSCGRRFSTRVSGLTLMDVVEKFSAISAMIQERLSKVTDCEQLKHCGDLIEQLKFLVEEPRGQRFVVNINVPPQGNAQTSNGSPITASSMRKRHHSNSERVKRSIKSQLNSIQQSEIMSPPSCHNVDTTPLESLPGNVDLLKQPECFAHTVIEKRDAILSQEPHKQCDTDKNNSTNSITTRNKNNSIRRSSDDVSSVRSCEMDIDDKRKEESNAISTIPKRYTTATSTEELLSFSSTEVQTIPYEIPESESESNDEPIENLSILTKEILNRTELQECIAENINKAIIPTDLSLKDENLNESMIGEGNTSIMAELNNAIKSIVEATESDPVFEKFLDEIIGPHTETDTSPEEDGEGKLSPKSVNEVQEKQMEAGVSNVSSPEPVIIDTKVSAEDGMADVPLKHRLRSSSRQQYNRVEDEVDKARDQEKDQSALEDQNAAAVLSIINANIINNVSDSDKKALDTKELITGNDEQKMQTMVPVINKNDAIKPLTATNVQKTSNVTLPANNNVPAKVKKSTVKRPRPTKPKRDQTTNDNQSSSVESNIIQPITEHEIMTMPTLIVCSKDEVTNFLINHSSTITSTSTSRFIPIAPKDSKIKEKKVETLFLRTVNVVPSAKPVAKTLPSVVEEPNNLADQVGFLHSSKNDNVNKRLKTIHKTDVPFPIINIDQQALNHPADQPVQTSKIVRGESITLYGNETSAKTSLDTNMPMINLEENISLSQSGLSPYLKFTCSKTNQSHNLSDIDLASVMESVASTTANNNKSTQSLKNVDIITKRTPKSLLKSRSKNHRLSLSTPRKRSSHIRVLDFSTPTRTSSTRKTNVDGNVQFSSTSAKRLKSVCRTSLFRSPSLSNTSTQKQKSPIKVNQSYRIPIATRSPAPKLMGGWDKYNGVGVIIGEVSPHGSTSASCSSSDDRIVQHKPSKPLVGSWDADLRKSIELNKRDEPETKKPVKRRKNSIKDKNDVICKKAKYNPRSTKSSDERKSCNKPKMNRKFNAEDVNGLEENSQENIIKSQNNEKEDKTKATINIVSSITNKSSESTNTCEAPAKISSTNTLNNVAVTAEKKPVKKYAQLKTISTNLRKPDNEKEKNTEVNLQVSEVSRILSTDSTQHILRMPDMISLETPRKFDNISGPPPTPRVLSPNSNLITPFIKISEDSSKIRSFITTPEFPITPDVALTPKEETTRDIIKKGEYNSPYYKPTSEQAENSDLKVCKPKDSSVQESPIISSSHNSLTSGNTYQTCSSSKLEITEFEVIKENLPREEAIKEFKIASTSKDSGNATELNASIVIDHHVDLIRVNEFKNVSEHRETIINGNDSVESSSSSSNTSSSSSSSSSSTSTSSNTNTSTNTCSPNGKCEAGKASSKTSTDSSDLGEKSINVPKNTHDVLTVPSDACKKSGSAIEMESSPKKVFAITKTDDELKDTLKETPAKDETLLNEADISETPSSSKGGVETINLATKISAILTEDEKLSRSNKSSKSNSKIPINKSRAQPKIIDVQCIRLGSVKFVEPLKPIKDECQSECEQSASVHDKFMHRQILEEKRQRIIAKIKDNPKLNIPSGTKRKRILTGKTANTLKKFGRRNRNVRPTMTKYSRDVNKNTEPQDDRQETLRKNTRKKCELQKQNFVNKCRDNEEQTTNRVVTLKSTDSNVTNYGNNGDKPLDDFTTKQSHEHNACENNIVENCKNEKSTQPHNSEDQNYLKEMPDSKENTEKNYSIKSNVDKEETGEILKNTNIQGKILKKETNLEKCIVQETLAPDKTKHDQTEDKVNKLRQFSNNVDKSDYKILKYKVDQVKRDLFSDEENDHRTSSTVSAKDNKTKKITDAETQNPEASDNANVEIPKQELSTVLQCLQLVPASKKEYLNNCKNQTEKQHKEQSEPESEDDNESHPTADVRNYKAEYHFVYDDSVPVRKRRRRYSGHELQIAINYADLSDPNPVECIKIMKATEFEEIFNLPPKKRTVNKKSRTKNEKIGETPNFQTDKDTLNLKDDSTKPLATSSPVDESSKAKIKMIIKTAATNKTNNNTQSDARKKQKLDKHQEKVTDIVTKSRKRKLSEAKETKQVEKKCTTARNADPQTLLSNLDEVDLNKFLTTVHGPE